MLAANLTSTPVTPRPWVAPITTSRSKQLQRKNHYRLHLLACPPPSCHRYVFLHGASVAFPATHYWPAACRIGTEVPSMLHFVPRARCSFCALVLWCRNQAAFPRPSALPTRGSVSIYLLCALPAEDSHSSPTCLVPAAAPSCGHGCCDSARVGSRVITRSPSILPATVFAIEMQAAVAAVWAFIQDSNPDPARLWDRDRFEADSVSKTSPKISLRLGTVAFLYASRIYCLRHRVRAARSTAPARARCHCGAWNHPQVASPCPSGDAGTGRLWPLCERAGHRMQPRNSHSHRAQRPMFIVELRMQVDAAIFGP